MLTGQAHDLLDRLPGAGGGFRMHDRDQLGFAGCLKRGFGLGDNTLVLLHGEDGRVELGTAQKSILAARLLDAIESLMAGA